MTMHTTSARLPGRHSGSVPAACRSRSELWLIAVYSLVAVALLGSVGAGLMLGSDPASLVTSADMQTIELAGR